MSFKLKILGLFMLLLVVGAASYFIWSMYFSNAAQVMNQVKGALNDPDSAKFSDVAYFSGTKAGCGSVNAKNRMGGYFGYTRFIALPNGEVRFEPQDSIDTGTSERKIEAMEKGLAFLKLLIDNCPNKKAEHKAE
jgi:hypothetical protein